MADMTLYSGDYATLDFAEFETSECSKASRRYCGCCGNEPVARKLLAGRLELPLNV